MRIGPTMLRLLRPKVLVLLKPPFGKPPPTWLRPCLSRWFLRLNACPPRDSALRALDPTAASSERPPSSWPVAPGRGRHGEAAPRKPNTDPQGPPPPRVCARRPTTTSQGEPGLLVGVFAVRLLECHGWRPQRAALALYEATLGGVGLHHHRELELLALGWERASFLLTGQLLSLDAQSLLQLADPAAHLEPAAGGQAQVGPLIRSLHGIDPGAPEPGLQDLVSKLPYVF